ncbi:hypothetical protein GDO78_019920 [Eleutherodactylus coqui]|uniref:Uncharacterized protein n=1 Tax=Eleutherodactylus coqui TaxID=57060 RepID=A0A8J6BIY0_ELECQ|nr:hypothetical protein GDO78_019920 [Eleutherodactylus coqui]
MEGRRPCWAQWWNTVVTIIDERIILKTKRYPNKLHKDQNWQSDSPLTTNTHNGYQLSFISISSEETSSKGRRKIGPNTNM